MVASEKRATETRILSKGDILATALGAALLALNNECASALSWLELEELADLVDRSFHARAVEPGAALLLAFDQAAAYDSPNFHWFRARYDRFVYVDRLVVAAPWQGRGLGRLLYDELFERARDRGHDRVGCEVNVDPPNPGSQAFHAALDFVPVGTARLPNGKAVRYFVKDLRREACKA